MLCLAMKLSLDGGGLSGVARIVGRYFVIDCFVTIKENVIAK
jgi:hypothetical protein